MSAPAPPYNSSAAANVVNKAILTEFIPWHVFQFSCSYDKIGIINNLVDDQFKIIDTQYSDQVTFTIHTTKEDNQQTLDNALKQAVSIQSFDDLLVETPLGKED